MSRPLFFGLFTEQRKYLEQLLMTLAYAVSAGVGLQHGELDTARCADLSVILDPNLDPTGGIFGTTGSYKMEQTPVVLPENPHQMTLSNTRAYKAARFFQSVTI